MRERFVPNRFLTLLYLAPYSTIFQKWPSFSFLLSVYIYIFANYMNNPPSCYEDNIILLLCSGSAW